MIVRIRTTAIATAQTVSLAPRWRTAGFSYCPSLRNGLCSPSLRNGETMALSNAERQKRHRQRLKARSASPAQITIPAALRSVVVWSFENDDGGYDPDGIVAEGIAGALRAIADSLGTTARELLDDEAPSSPLIAAFGGADYVREALEWCETAAAWSSSRKRDKGPFPPPPAAPSV
jgi:hypothetical protein